MRFGFDVFLRSSPIIVVDDDVVVVDNDRWESYDEKESCSID